MRNIEFHSNKRRAKVKALSKVGKNTDYVVFLRKTNINMYTYLLDIASNKVLASMNTFSKAFDGVSRSKKAAKLGSDFAAYIKNNFSNVVNKNSSLSNVREDAKFLSVAVASEKYIGCGKEFVDNFNNILK